MIKRSLHSHLNNENGLHLEWGVLLGVQDWWDEWFMRLRLRSPTYTGKHDGYIFLNFQT